MGNDRFDNKHGVSRITIANIKLQVHIGLHTSSACYNQTHIYKKDLWHNVLHYWSLVACGGEDLETNVTIGDNCYQALNHGESLSFWLYS
jgi:hypothetical protein